MTTPKIRPSQRRHTPERKDWKDSPLVIAALSVAGTATFMSAVVMPIAGSLQSARIERLSELSASAAGTAEELARTKQELVNARAALKQAVERRPFADGSVYPIGADSVVIGTPADDVLIRFPSAKWDEDGAYVSVDFPDNPVFYGAAYYLGGKNPKRVESILFHVRDRDAAHGEIIRRFVLSKLGEPSYKKKRGALWRVSPREWVTIEEVVAGAGVSYYVLGDRSPLLSAKWGDLVKDLK